MPCPTFLRNCLALTLALMAATASARTLDLRAQSLQSSLAQARGIRLHLDWPDTAQKGQLSLDVEAANAPDFGYHFRKLHWVCVLTPIRDGWRCDGVVNAAGGKPVQLVVDLDAASTRVQLSQGAASLIVQQSAANPDATVMTLQQAPIAWIRPYIATLWSAARLQKGQVAGRLTILAPVRSPLQVSGPLTLRGFALDTPDGTVATDGLNAAMQLHYTHSPSRRTLALQGRLEGGEVLYSNLYAKLPSTPVTMTLQATQARAGDWDVAKLTWDDPGVLAVQGSARLAPDLGLRDATITIDVANLAVSTDRYLSGWLGTAGFAGLALQGSANVDMRVNASGLQRAQVRLQHVAVKDAKQRFALTGMTGDIAWTATTASVDSSLRLGGGAIYDLPLGATTLALRSTSRKLDLRHPASLTLLGGTLEIESFGLVPANDRQATRFVLGLRMQDLQLAPMAKAFGWPAFPGTLSGHLPAARFADDVLRFDGGLDAQVFGGKVTVAKLVMERPFGVAPTLSADIDLDNLDLKSLTGVFGFGQITGRLDGSIHNLRLLDWTPVAFDAQLHSDPSQPDKRRISQRAVKDLSNVGGSGIAGGLQAQVLKVFQDFGYAKLGLACRLENNVCHMGGISAATKESKSSTAAAVDTTGSGSAGYTIVQGSGLPRITVVGFAREVDWPTLLSRLKAASEGNGPVVK